MIPIRATLSHKIGALCCFLLLSGITTAQEFDYSAQGTAAFLRSSQANLPFWMQANTNGAIGEGSNFLFAAGFDGTYNFENDLSLSGKASLFYRDEVPTELQRDELYVQFDSRWVSVVLGARRNVDRFAGLSTVQDNFLMSGNARAIPGFLVESPYAQRIFDWLDLDWGIAHYELNDDRFVEGAMLHYKRLIAHFKFSPRTTLRAGIQHYAQWGGFSPERGQQPEGFSDFIDIFLARKGGEGAADTDQANALGNHLGVYQLEFEHRMVHASVILYHDHPFEDGSGTRLQNFPDGIWGVYFKTNDKDYDNFLKGLVFEYFQTTNQSGDPSDPSGADNYFRSGVYRSGWTYDGNIIGFPFISMDETGLEIGNNRVRGFHLGISMGRRLWEIKAKISTWENFGNWTDSGRFDPPQQILNSFIGFDYDFQKYGLVFLNAGADWGDGFRDTYGISVGYRYVLN